MHSLGKWPIQASNKNTCTCTMQSGQYGARPSYTVYIQLGLISQYHSLEGDTLPARAGGIRGGTRRSVCVCVCPRGRRPRPGRAEMGLVEAPGTAPGSAALIPHAVYRHSRSPGAGIIGGSAPDLKGDSGRRQGGRI